MKTANVLLLGVGALFLFNFFNLGIAANVVQVVFAGFQVDNLTSYRITFIIQNVSNLDITVNSMAGTATLNGDMIGNVSYFAGPITIPANSQHEIKVNVKASLITIPGAIRDFISQDSGTDQANIAVTGNINISNLPQPIPFSVSETISI